MKDFNLFEYYKAFKHYAYTIHDSRRISEARTLKLCMKADKEETAKETIELIKEGLLPTYQEMEIEVAYYEQ